MCLNNSFIDMWGCMSWRLWHRRARITVEITFPAKILNYQWSRPRMIAGRTTLYQDTAVCVRVWRAACACGAFVGRAYSVWWRSTGRLNGEIIILGSKNKCIIYTTSGHTSPSVHVYNGSNPVSVILYILTVYVYTSTLYTTQGVSYM